MKKKHGHTDLPEIVLLGISHKTAPVAIREKFAFPPDVFLSFIEKVKSSGINEVVYLSTCNRVSIYFSTTDVAKGLDSLIAILAEYSGLKRSDFEQYLYKKYARDAVLHLFTVTSSLDSMVIGENEIFNQVKNAYRSSVQHQITGMLINRLFHQAFSTAKRVKTETDIAQNPLSIASIATEQAKKILGDLLKKKTLLIGAGEMAELILKYLTKSGIGDITIANRTLPNAEKLVKEISTEARVVGLDAIISVAHDTDIIISSITCHNYLITEKIAHHIMQRRKGRALFMIDIGVPRTIDPSIINMKSVFLYNIDDLKQIADENMQNRLNEVKVAQHIVHADATAFMKWYEELEVVPLIVKVKKNYNDVRQRELEKYRRRKLKHLSGKDFALVEELTHQIMTKILHNPIMAIKRYQKNKSNSHFDIESIVEELFKKEK